MTRYIAEILKKLGIDYQKYDIKNHMDEESGETWITLHPNSNIKANSSMKSKVDSIFEGSFGKYKIYWDEKSCYLNIIGILEINSNGEQIFPLPTLDKPALFSKDYILELWKNSQDMTDLKQYIYPIYSEREIVGQGFIADGYFITAAHVVKDYPSCYVVLNEKRLEFSKEKPLFMGKGDIYHDEKMMDIAVYSYDEIESPLHLSDYYPQKEDMFYSLCIQEASIPFSIEVMAPQIPSFVVSQELAIVIGKEDGNYFYCHCNRFGGSSGSPLLNGNDVVGIMHGGDDNGLCAFIKTHVLKSIIFPLGTRLQFEMQLPEFKDKLVEQENGWTVKKTRCFDDEEIAMIARAEVVPSPEGKIVCFFMMTGGRTYIPLIESSKLTVGETLDLTKARIIKLRKGNQEITRIMEISSSNCENKHNVEEELLSTNKIRFLDSRQYELSSIKPEADLIARYLNNNFQKYLYHFTHKENLEQIKEMGGLYSWVQLESMGKPCKHPGGDALSRKLDSRYGVADYVHLSFSHKHPMSYRNEKDIVILFIHPIVCLLPDTLFCNMNATDKNHIIGPTYKDLVNINLWTPIMSYLNSGTREFKEKQAEVLVKSHIPLEYIVNIDMVS